MGDAYKHDSCLVWHERNVIKGQRSSAGENGAGNAKGPDRDRAALSMIESSCEAGASRCMLDN